MQRFEIFNAAYVWNGCDDLRPWLVVDARTDGTVDCFPISSQCYSGDCFPLDMGHSDFARTGLARSCHIHTTHIINVPGRNFRKRRGSLVGELLAEFRQYSGL